MDREKILKSFESRTKKTPTCWQWIGATNIHGYGKLSTRLAHRVAAWLFLDAEIYSKPHLYVSRRCDNRLCVNPEHLFLCTPSENKIDLVKKGRNGFGRTRSVYSYLK